MENRLVHRKIPPKLSIAEQNAFHAPHIAHYRAMSVKKVSELRRIKIALDRANVGRIGIH